MKAAIVLFATCFLLMNTARGAYTVIEGHGMYRVGQSTAAANAWAVAYDTCRKEGGNLAVIDSTQEANALKPLLAASTSQFFYIGFTDILIEGHYLTIYGEPLDEKSYVRWYNGAPNGGNSTNCGAVSADMELADLGCSLQNDYICEIPLWFMYDYFRDIGYYKFYTDGLTWKEAVKKCESEGAQLLVVDTYDEYAAALQLFREHPNLPNTDNSSLINYGIHDYFINGVTVTIKGENVTTLTRPKWGTNEPKKDATNNIATMDRNGVLYMNDGTKRLAYICEHNLLTNASLYFNEALPWHGKISSVKLE